VAGGRDGGEEENRRQVALDGGVTPLRDPMFKGRNGIYSTHN
jgi:hypothetical protein